MRLDEMSDAVKIPAKMRYNRSCQSFFDSEFNSIATFTGDNTYQSIKPDYELQSYRDSKNQNNRDFMSLMSW